MNIISNADLTALNFFKVSLSADYLISIREIQDLYQVIEQPEFQGLPKLVIGSGSNMLLALKRFSGVVLLMQLSGIETVQEDENYVWWQVAAGEEWSQLVSKSLAENLFGLENLTAIPGTVGAAPIQNIGAYGVELADCFENLEAMDLSDGTLKHFDKEQCQFGYRDSIFKQRVAQSLVITSITLRLLKQPRLQLHYGELAQWAKNQREAFRAKTITPQMVSDQVAKIRKQKLPDPNSFPNVGSFFKNPVVSLTYFKDLQTQYPKIPGHRISNHQIKLSAAWLLECCGWKGKKVGKVGVSSQHALVLVNFGTDNGHEIFELARQIQASMLQQFGLTLEIEPMVIEQNQVK